LYWAHDPTHADGGSPDPDDVQGRGRTVGFPTPQRAFFLNAGLSRRLDVLSRQYFLASVPLAAGDVVVDVGANIGELGLWLETHAPRVRYIAFEPSPSEYECLVKNTRGGETHQCGLWNEPTVLQFYINSGEADSSLIEPAAYDRVEEVTCHRLDDMLPRAPIKLLKIDAEGAEPEVLQGAAGLLPLCDHVIVDAGPERGADLDVTAPAVINYMVARGFDVAQVDSARLVVAFRNREPVTASAHG
jgi:FkbM family methyltransferase